MDGMRRFRSGFTLIEVALFLAVTGALFVGVTVGVQNSIFQQRYTDAVQNYAEFLRGIYAEVANVQNPLRVDETTGRTETAIYGKLVAFGESTDLNGCPVNNSDAAAPITANCTNDKSKNSIFVYDVIGDVGDVDSGNIKESLRKLNANVVVEKDGTIEPVGIVEEYVPKWAAQIERTSDYKIFKGAVLIARHPKSGTIYTYVREGENETLELNQKIAEIQKDIESLGIEARENEISGLLVNELDKFRPGQVDFCVNPNAGEEYAFRRDVRMVLNARNASGVEIVSADVEEDNKCIIR